MISEETSALSTMHGDLITYYSVTIVTVVIFDSVNTQREMVDSPVSAAADTCAF
jgi:hypothetical protein